jgi:hypothetical protein
MFMCVGRLFVMGLEIRRYLMLIGHHCCACAWPCRGVCDEFITVFIRSFVLSPSWLPAS